MIERVTNPGSSEDMAIIIRHGDSPPGVKFVSDPGHNLQVATIRHPAGHVIQAHYHKQQLRQIHGTSEVLVVKKGVVDVTFYTEDGVPVCAHELGRGDVLILLSGGHGFEVVDDCEMVEVKNGPYNPVDDKVRFIPKGIA